MLRTITLNKSQNRAKFLWLHLSHQRPSSKSQTVFARFSNGLENLEVGVLIAASRLDDSITAQAADIRREIMASYLQTSAHVELLQTDYMNVFTAALERALATDLGTENIIECGATGIAALTGRSTCEGTDLNGTIAAIIDRIPSNRPSMRSMAFHGPPLM